MPARNEIVNMYGEYSLKLANFLKQERKIGMDEFIFIENHLLIVQLAITQIKYSGQKPPNPIKVQGTS
ncbi:MAG TPA: hypothetical protein VJ746_18065 [Nitrospira sp.]|nr:hypothetical protein [Nitrospira sp.]